MAITKKQIDEWRALRNSGMTSAVGEYTPSEFWEALDEIELLRRILKDANEICRSAYSIAGRNGNATNWSAFTKRLSAVLTEQHTLLYGSDRRNSEPE